MKHEKIVHKEGKVESYLAFDDLGNLVESRTFKYYASYFRTVENIANEKERKRLLKNLPLQFKHECEMIALANSKGLPAVRLICQRSDNQIEMEYLESVTLEQRLQSPDATKEERRRLITATLRCMQRFHTAGIFQGDPNPSNFLLTSTGQIIFCDFGNACSPQELPFEVPPLAKGNSSNRQYFSEAQHAAYVTDRAMDREHLASSYSAEKLASNRLGAKDDFFVFAHHALQIKIQITDVDNNPLEQLSAAHLLDPDLKRTLERMKRGDFAAADEILQQMFDTAPVGMQPTPEIDSCEETLIQKKPFWFNLPIGEFDPKATKRFLQRMSAPVIVIGICVVAGLAIGSIYEGYRHILPGKPTIETAVAPSSTAKTGTSVVRQGALTDMVKQPSTTKDCALPQAKIAEQPTPEKVAIEKPVSISILPRALSHAAEQLSKPVESADYRNALDQLAQMKTPEASKVLESHLEKTKSDASSTHFPQASSGIRALHLIAGVKSPVSCKAVTAIDDVIQNTIQAGPSEEASQRLELLASLGNARAHHALAVWLESGNGLKGRDLAAAYRHYVAASRKVTEAARVVTRMESMAPAMVKNPSTRPEGIRLLLAIAERPQNSKAQCAVGCFYAEGKYGLSPNPQLAKDYLTRSARNGFVGAKTALKYYKLRG